MKPYLQDPDLTIWNGDVREVLRALPDESMHACITSPPFFGLRDYGVDGQIGLEASPEEWVAQLVEVFAEVRRVLRSDGTLWIECGDSYNSNPSWGRGRSTLQGRPQDEIPNGDHMRKFRLGETSGLKPKDLIGQPFMLAFALRGSGWFWRSMNVWEKPNAMPESVTDRPSVAHSHVMQFGKSAEPQFWTHAIYGTATRPKPAPDYWWFPPADAASEEPLQHEVKGWQKKNAWRGSDYFYDADAIRDPHSLDGRKVTAVKQGDNSIQHRDGERWPNGGRNARSVWSIATQPLPFQHFASYPEALVAKILKAATSEMGCCRECASPFKRITERTLSVGAHGIHKVTAPREAAVATDLVRSDKRSRDGFIGGQHYEVRTLGWSPTCSCPSAALEPVQYRPSVVLDPFLGSGTSALVARRLGRRCVGIELNPDYCALAARRTQQLSLEAGEAVA